MTALFDCPCCGLPTLGERSCYVICPVCWWEDDGQEGDRADEVWGGPNGKYSLTDARKNVRSHGHMHDDGAGIEIVEKPSPTRLRLLEVALPVVRGEAPLDRGKFAVCLALENGHRNRDEDDFDD